MSTVTKRRAKSFEERAVLHALRAQSVRSTTLLSATGVIGVDLTLPLSDFRDLNKVTCKLFKKEKGTLDVFFEVEDLSSPQFDAQVEFMNPRLAVSLDDTTIALRGSVATQKGYPYIVRMSTVKTESPNTFRRLVDRLRNDLTDEDTVFTVVNLKGIFNVIDSDNIGDTTTTATLHDVGDNLVLSADGTLLAMTLTLISITNTLTNAVAILSMDWASASYVLLGMVYPGKDTLFDDVTNGKGFAAGLMISQDNKRLLIGSHAADHADNAWHCYAANIEPGVSCTPVYLFSDFLT